MQAIGVANGGGDCPGLNTVIRAVVRAAILDHGWRVVGIQDGFDGLIWPERTSPLTVESIAGILPRGGTILGTRSRGDPFHHTVNEGSPKVNNDDAETCRGSMKKLGLDALVVIGGDGTLTIARDLGRMGIPIVGVPKTIDNDLSATEVTFGFDTALHVATDAIDRLHTTAQSHGRVMVIEVMGRDAGWIALHSGIAGGADVILIPEIPFTIEAICEKLRERAARGSNFSIVVVAEGVKLPLLDSFRKPFPKVRPGQVGMQVGDAIHAALDQDVRVTVLGHIQRGGSPSPFDRFLATRFGAEAVELVARGEFGRMVCLRAGEIESVLLDEAVGEIRLVDPQGGAVRAARSVGITFGDHRRIPGGTLREPKDRMAEAVMKEVGMADGRKRSTKDHENPAPGFVEKDFADVLEEERENDRMLAAVGSNLARIGKRLGDLGRALEKPETISDTFELGEFEDVIVQISALLSRYNELRATKLKIQSQLANLSWHRS